MRMPVYTNQFEKDMKLMIKRGCDPENIKSIVSELIEEIPLERKHRKIAEWGQNHPTKKKGLTITWLTPFIYWLLSADSNHGPAG